MAEDRDGNPSNLSGVERALDVLSLFTESESPTLGVTEISKAFGLSKAVVYRVLSACRAKDFVEMEEATHRYRLGVKSMYLGFAYLGRLDLRVIAKKALQQLVAATNETATLSIRAGWSRVYIDQVVPNREIQMTVKLGQPFQLHTGASSKAMLAFLPESERDEYLVQHELVRLTAVTITDRSDLRRELESIRVKGYAVSFGERDASAASGASPFLKQEGQLSAVISACGPLGRFRLENEQVSTLLLEVTRDVSQRLGFKQRIATLPLDRSSSKLRQ
jgi:DNA-binding IclR family transcriptional regulator